VWFLHASIAGETSARGERACELGKQARDRINADFNVDDPNMPPRVSQKLVATATLLRAMPAPSTPEARNLYREAQELIEQVVVQQAESSASRIRKQGRARDDDGAGALEPSVHKGGVAARPTNPGRTPAKERLLDTRGQAQDGDARNVINARRTNNAEARPAAGYHPQRGERYDGREDRSPTPEPPGTRVFSREIRTASFPQRFRQPTTIVKYNGETDPRVWLNNYRLACQLGRATNDEVIIHNPPPAPRRLGADVARAPADQPDPQLGRPGLHIRRKFPGHIRAPWELLGPAFLHPETRRVALGLHTTLLQALYGAPKHGAV
jgi:hypothetical protein